MKISTTAFAAVQQFPKGKPLLMPWSVASTATSVRNTVGDSWRNEDETDYIGWQKAKKNGFRVIKVKVIEL